MVRGRMAKAGTPDRERLPAAGAPEPAPGKPTEGGGWEKSGHKPI